MVRAHLQEPAIVLPCLADEDRLNRRLHIVVDAAPTGPAVESKRLVMGVEHQLLRLPEVGAHKRHPAVRQPHVRRLDHQRQSLQRDPLVAPVELVSFTGSKAHRHERLGRNACALLPPLLHEPMNAVMRAVIAAARATPRTAAVSTAAPASAASLPLPGSPSGSSPARASSRFVWIS